MVQYKVRTDDNISISNTDSTYRYMINEQYMNDYTDTVCYGSPIWISLGVIIVCVEILCYHFA